MNQIYLIRHTESLANVNNILAGQSQVALSAQGKRDAAILAKQFSRSYSIALIYCSPLLRAQQTAAPFVTACDAPIIFDTRLQEQNLGHFTGLTYAQAEADPGYCQNRLARWNWQPQGGGESYQMIADRVSGFLRNLYQAHGSKANHNILIVTHAVTLRLFRACLEQTLPNYPERIAANGELWQTELTIDTAKSAVKEIKLALPLHAHRA